MEEPQTAAADRLAFIAAGDAENLPSLMSDLEDLKMELVTIPGRSLSFGLPA